MSQRYQFIEQEKANHPVRTLCRVMKVSHGGYYDWRKRTPSKRAQANEELLELIRTICEMSKGQWQRPQ